MVKIKTRSTISNKPKFLGILIIFSLALIVVMYFIESIKPDTENLKKNSTETNYKSNTEETNFNQQKKYQADFDCEFKNDTDVLRFLRGKTFRQKDGGITVSFNYDGCTFSGNMKYQWISYRTLGGYKGVVKLASVNSINPNGTITLYVSCREKSITDGKIVLLYN